MKTHGWLLQTAGMHNCSIVKYDWQYSSAFLYDISGISTLQWLYLIGMIALKWTDCVSKPIFDFLTALRKFLWPFLTVSNVFFHSCFFLLRVPRWELQIGCEQQAKEGADSIHERANSRTGGRIRPSQLFDQTQAVRNRRKPGSHGKAGEMTERDLVLVHQSFCQKLLLFFFFSGFSGFLSSHGMGLLYSRCFCKLSFWL